MKKLFNKINLKSIWLWGTVGLLAYGALFLFVLKPHADALIPDAGRNLLDAPFSDIFEAMEKDPAHAKIRFVTRKEDGQVVVHCDCTGGAIKSLVPDGGQSKLIARALELKVRIDAEDDLRGGHLKQSTLADYFNILATIASVAIGALFIYLMSRRGGPMGGMSGQAKNNGLKRIDSNVKFEDIAGIDEAKAELEIVVQFLKDRKTLEEAGGELPRAILMTGGPGVGKTLLARAIAGEAGLPFFAIKMSALVEMYVGVGAARWREYWTEASKFAPCIVFCDEIDAVGGKRSNGAGGNQEREVTLNEVLVSLDGIEGRYPIVVIAATNRADMLDDALKSRFTRTIEVPNPNTSGRKEIFRIHARKINIVGKDDPEVWESILQRAAEASEGMAGRGIMQTMTQKIFNNCVMKYGKILNPLPAELIFEALEAEMLGDPLLSKLRRPGFRIMVAKHEAGHLIVGETLARYSRKLQEEGKLPEYAWFTHPTRVATIVPRSTGSEGVVLMTGDDPDTSKFMTWQQIVGFIATAQAGNAAEFMEFGTCSIGNAGDNQASMRLAIMAVTKSAMSVFGPRSIAVPPIFLGDNGQTAGFMPPPQPYGASEGSQEQIDKAIGEFLWAGRFAADAILAQRRGLLAEIAELLMKEGTIRRPEYEALFDKWDESNPMDHEAWLKYYKLNGGEKSEIELRKEHFAKGGALIGG